MGASGCVQWMFSKKGQVTVPASAADEDTIAEIALEAGADDYEQSDDVWEISCEPSAYEDVRSAIRNAGLEIQSAELAMIPASSVTVNEDDGRKVLRLIEELEDHDDVQNVYSNFEIPDEVMAAIGE
jgi:transcriptional/translational regulatory protein YebC/TACO1